MAAKDLYEKDFYKILGLGKSASGDEIKKKYRSLARELHPDKTKGDAAMEEKFKAVSEAYDILSDGKKRAEYDQARDMFERGGFRAPQGGQNFQGGDFSDIFGGGNPQDIFANLFGGGGRRGPRKGQDLQTEATITFKEAAFGTTLELRLSADGGPSQTISARVPAGVNDGAKIRVKGKGSKGDAGPGDLFIMLHVKPHAIFSRKGENIAITVPVTFTEAALGADIKVPTLTGEEVTLRLSPGTSNGRVLRVKGRGISKGATTGDLLVTVEVQVPSQLDEIATEALKKYAEATSEIDVRAELKPEEKVAAIRELTRQGKRVAMVGDGVNDAPSLAVAYIGVAMGARGSDAALEQADVVLMHDRLENFLAAFRLSQRAQRIIRQNLVLSLGTVAVLVVMALLGKIPLTLGVIGHEGSTVVVVMNSLRLLFGKNEVFKSKPS